MARQKHQPQRTCVGCREVKNKRDLLRIVRTPEQTIIIDPTGKANGRGLYVCRSQACLEKGLKKERIGQLLKVALSPDEVADLWISVQNALSKV
ncbi:MAG TPA: YlxR family protein [Anaerolineae bacterium]|nr:YlxR family protein [Anaerolineae bacterium]HMR62392.1 YlxR family protein [Anaerolineae bacterium]